MAPHSGWGGAFCAHHVKSSVACLNGGRGGRSTRSYRQEGSWDIALAEAKVRSEEHTSELQSLMRISYAVFCLKKKKTDNRITTVHSINRPTKTDGSERYR